MILDDLQVVGQPTPEQRDLGCAEGVHEIEVVVLGRTRARRHVGPPDTELLAARNAIPQVYTTPGRWSAVGCWGSLEQATEHVVGVERCRHGELHNCGDQLPGSLCSLNAFVESCCGSVVRDGDIRGEFIK